MKIWSHAWRTKVYNPSSFSIDDPNLILALLREQSFGAFVSHNNEKGIEVSHLPFIVDNECTTIRSHLARANKQWKSMEEGEVLLIVQGAHRYISSLWYKDPDQVSTWNYAVVHVHGTVRITHDEDELFNIVRDLNMFFDAEPGVDKLKTMSSEVRSNLIKAIVGFELSITKIEAKCKMSQNRRQDERDQVLIGLDAAPDHAAKEVAGLVRLLNRQIE